MTPLSWAVSSSTCCALTSWRARKHVFVKRHEDAFPWVAARSRRKAPRAVSGKARKLRRREHGTAGHDALPQPRKRAAVRSAPGRDRAEARFIRISDKKARTRRPSINRRSRGTLACGMRCKSWFLPLPSSRTCRNVPGKIANAVGNVGRFHFPGSGQSGGRHGQGAGRGLCARARRSSTRSTRRSARSSPSSSGTGRPKRSR